MNFVKTKFFYISENIFILIYEKLSKTQKFVLSILEMHHDSVYNEHTRGEDMKTFVGKTQAKYGVVIQGVFGVFTEAF